QLGEDSIRAAVGENEALRVAAALSNGPGSSARRCAMTSNRKEQIARLVDQYEQLTKCDGSDQKLALDERALAKAIAQEMRADEAMSGLARNQARYDPHQHLLKLARPTNAPAQRKAGKSGRKRKFTPAQLEALRSMAFDLLEYFGDPSSDNPHPEFKSK